MLEEYDLKKMGIVAVLVVVIIVIGYFILNPLPQVVPEQPPQTPSDAQPEPPTNGSPAENNGIENGNQPPAPEPEQPIEPFEAMQVPENGETEAPADIPPLPSPPEG